MVALDGKRWQAGEVPLDVAPQGKQLIELPELPQPKSAGQLWLTVRSATERDHMVSNRTRQRTTTVASGGKPQRDALRAHAIPQLTTSERICIELDNKRCNLTASQAFFHRCGLAIKNNCLAPLHRFTRAHRWITTLA
jgi:beta-galactosidase